MDMLKDLNPDQKMAVETISGPVLVVAGPGSGKTKTLTHRIAYLIGKGVRPQNILAVTFTNKAAEEMRSRVQALLAPATANFQFSPPGANPPWAEIFNFQTSPLIGTFHSICARILRREAHALGYGSDFTIYDEEDALKLVKNIMQGLGIDPKQYNPAKIRSVISRLKDDLITPADYEMEADGPFEREVRKTYAAYRSALKKQNAMDFDDLLMKTVELFEKNSGILDKYRAQFQHVLIDEFQDTNLSQYKIANCLAKRHKNLYCIGDLDQSIYSFRGADYRNILYFEKDWPEARVITLGQNYRSAQNILDAADGIISQNENRKAKSLWTENGRGEAVVIKEAEDETGEGEFIVNEIERLVKEDAFRMKDCVVLYRTNAQSRAVEESFLRRGFPYKIIGGIKFYQRKEIKDILAVLRLCINKDDIMARDRLSGIPMRFLNPKSKTRNPKQIRNSKFQILNSLIADFAEKSKTMGLTDFLAYVIKNTGFEKYLRDGTEKGEERWDNVRELLSVCVKYDPSASSGQATSGLDGVRQLLEEAALAQEADNVEYASDLVNLMTLHAAKGLEFPAVFIAGCEQGLLPHSRALLGLGQDELEEERRLCYVGVTRAKRRLYLSFARRRTMFGRNQSNPPSEFLRHIPEHLIKFMPAEEENVIELD